MMLWRLLGIALSKATFFSTGLNASLLFSSGADPCRLAQFCSCLHAKAEVSPDKSLKL